MLPRAHSGSTTFSPEDGLVRRVVSERDGLQHLRATLAAMEGEPTTWFAPSRDAYVQRLSALGEELSRAIRATDSLVQQMEWEQRQAQQHDNDQHWQRVFVVGS